MAATRGRRSRPNGACTRRARFPASCPPAGPLRERTALELRIRTTPFTLWVVRLAAPQGTPRATKRPAPRLASATPRRAAILASRLAFVVAAFVAVFLPARTASAFGGVDAIGLAGLAGLCDPDGASAVAPAGPFVMVQDEATLVAAALAAGITDPRGASMNAPLAVVVPEGAISGLDDARCEKADGSPAIRQAIDDHRNAPDATPVADIDPAVPASLTPPPFVLVREEALPSLTRDDVPRPAHVRDVEHPPRLVERSTRARSRPHHARVNSAALLAAPPGPRSAAPRCTRVGSTRKRLSVCGSPSSRPVIVRSSSSAPRADDLARTTGAARLDPSSAVPLKGSTK